MENGMISALGAQPGRTRYSRRDTPTLNGLTVGGSALTASIRSVGQGLFNVPASFPYFNTVYYNPSIVGYNGPIVIASSAASTWSLSLGLVGNYPLRATLYSNQSVDGIDLSTKAINGDVRILTGGTFADQQVERMRITGANYGGNVGIGTATPSQALTVAGGILSIAGTITPGSFTISSLPATAANGKVFGAHAIVTDSTPVNPGDLIASHTGGTSAATVQYDGANWIAAAGPATYISSQYNNSMALLASIY